MFELPGRLYCERHTTDLLINLRVAPTTPSHDHRLLHNTRVAAFTPHGPNRSELPSEDSLCSFAGESSWQCGVSEDGANLDQIVRFNAVRCREMQRGRTLNSQTYMYVTILALQFKDELPEIVTAPVDSLPCVHFTDTV